MFLLPNDSLDFRFPPVNLASPEGLLAIGGDLCSDRLLTAYRHGVFPWYNQGQPIMWWSPDPRAILFLDNLKISHSLRKTLRRNKFQITLDTEFRQVIQACAAPRTQQGIPGTWIHPEMIDAYVALHEKGYAHSVECWQEGTLAGGIYGIALGGAFCGESMFSRVTDASKVALVHLCRQLKSWDFDFIDGQISSPHLTRLGSQDIRRTRFMALLQSALQKPDRKGCWNEYSPSQQDNI